MFASSSGGYRLLTGHDRRTDFLRPKRSVESNRIDWFDSRNEPQREMIFVSPLLQPFVWAEGGDGGVLATGLDGRLQHFLSDGVTDDSFHSPGRMVSVIALPDGKWLVDGTRRLLADGRPDPSWHVADLTSSGRIHSIQPLEDGRMLVIGRFSSIQGRQVRDLAILNGDGSVDTSFNPDPRSHLPLSAAVSGGAVYVVTSHPAELPGGGFSNLIRLDATGALDESFDPTPDTLLWGQQFTRVFAQPDGAILAEKRSWSSDVIQHFLFIMDSTGAVPAKRPDSTSWDWPRILALQEGGFVAGPEMYGPDGELVRRLGGTAALDPVCEWRGGILFTEEIGGSPARQRLRLWRDGQWEPDFAATLLPKRFEAVQATEGDAETLYLSAGDGTRRIRRMLRDGTMDDSFVAPEWTFRTRREASPWKNLGPDGLEAGDSATWDLPLTPAHWVFHPGSAKLWVGGSFNLAGGSDRAGLARLETGQVPPPPGSPRTAYESWTIGMGLEGSGAEDDDDGDGVVNSLEFLFGTDPRQPSGGADVTLEDGQAVFSYPLSLEAIDSTCVVEFSDNLEDWQTADETNSITSSVPEHGDIMRIRVAVPMEHFDRLFFRLKAEIR